MKVSVIVKFSISLLLAGVIFYFVFKTVSFEEFWDRLFEVNYWWVILSMLLAWFSHVLRAIRWELMLTPLGYPVKVTRIFHALMSGYLANLAFPRLGEVTRCGILKKTNDVPITLSFGTVVVERLLDLGFLISLMILDLIIEFDRVFEFFKSAVKWEERGFDLGHILIMSAAIIGLGLLSMYAIKRMLRKEFSNPILIKVTQKLQELIAGFLSIRNVSNLPLFIVCSIGIWVCYFLMSFVIFFSIPETSDLGIGAGLSILAAAGVAMATPVQGGIGAYHFLVSQVLIIYGIDVETSKFFAFLLHTSQVIFVIVIGGISFVIASFISKKKPTDLAPQS